MKEEMPGPGVGQGRKTLKAEKEEAPWQVGTPGRLAVRWQKMRRSKRRKRRRRKMWMNLKRSEMTEYLTAKECR